MDAECQLKEYPYPPAPEAHFQIQLQIDVVGSRRGQRIAGVFGGVSIDESDAPAHIGRQQLEELAEISVKDVAVHQIDAEFIGQLYEQAGFYHPEIEKDTAACRERNDIREQPQMSRPPLAEDMIHHRRTEHRRDSDAFEAQREEQHRDEEADSLSLVVLLLVDGVVDDHDAPAVDHIVQLHLVHRAAGVVRKSNEQTDVLRNKSPDARPSCDLQSHKTVCHRHAHQRQRHGSLTEQVDRRRREHQVREHIENVQRTAQDVVEGLKLRDPDGHRPHPEQ